MSDPTSLILTDWRTELPCLTGNLVSLREMRASDAPALFAALSSEQVSRFISPPPATVDGFGDRTHGARSRGRPRVRVRHHTDRDSRGHRPGPGPSARPGVRSRRVRMHDRALVARQQRVSRNGAADRIVHVRLGRHAPPRGAGAAAQRPRQRRAAQARRRSRRRAAPFGAAGRRLSRPGALVDVEEDWGEHWVSVGPRVH